MLAGLALAVCTANVAGAQAEPHTGAPTDAGTPAKTPAPAQALQLQTLDPQNKPDPFPPVNAKYFTAASPTVDTVNTFLKALWGYDSNRIWRVEAIQKTSAPDVSKVIVYLSDKSPNAKVQITSFFVTPDGKHAIAGEGVIPFGPTPFADIRKMIEARADGASRGGKGNDLLLVEFADMQCPHCKDAQGTIEQLAKDFPNARLVYQSYPLVDIHPFAFKAAAYGYCVEKQSADAFFPYAAAVFDAQGALTPDAGDETLKSAVTKAGLDPATVDACAATQAIKDQVNASIKLAQDAGVEQTPMLAVNGHLLPLTGVPYETLKTIIAYQATLDGVATGATADAAASSRTPPTLGK